MRQPSRQILVGTALGATILMNVIANALPLNGRTTGEIADQFRIFVTPAGYAFSIWSLIYVSLAAYAVYQFTAAGRASSRVQGIARPFLVTCVANISWLTLWHYGYYVATLAAMGLLLATLVLIYLRLRVTPARSQTELWCVDIPFRLYTGWITVATLVNLSVLLDVLDARPFGASAVSWAIWMIVAAGVFGLAVGHRWRDLTYQAVIIWAMLGIALKEGQPAMVATAASVCATLIAVHALLRRFLERRTL